MLLLVVACGAARFHLHSPRHRMSIDEAWSLAVSLHVRGWRSLCNHTALIQKLLLLLPICVPFKQRDHSCISCIRTTRWNC